MPVHLPPFDASRPFVAQRNFRFHGAIYRRGEPFPREDVAAPGERKMRQLYETRQINYEGVEQTRSHPYRSPKERAIVEERRLAQLDHDDDGKAGGSKPKNVDVSDEAKAYANKKGHTHDFLFQKASGLTGVTKSMTKAQIAQALIDAGRADDGAA